MGLKKLFLKKLYQTASTERIFNYWRSLFLEEFLFMLMPVLTSDLTMSNFVHSHMDHKRSSDNFFSCSATLKPATFQQVFSRIKTNTPVFFTLLNYHHIDKQKKDMLETDSSHPWLGHEYQNVFGVWAHSDTKTISSLQLCFPWI